MKHIISIFLFGILFVTTGYAQSTTEENSAVTPASRDGRAYDRFLMLNKRVQDNRGDIDLLFVGDSITERWETKGSSIWNDFYGSRKAVNIGISADRTQHVLWRLENGNIKGISPEVTVLLIGTNNSGLSRNSTSEMLAGVTAVVEKLQKKLPETKIILLGMFPRGKKFNEQRGKITQVNQAMQKLEDNNTVHYLDIGHVFLQPDGTISKEIMPDALHLSPEGYRRWAKAMEPLISDLLY